jgi:hypothetical protein
VMTPSENSHANLLKWPKVVPCPDAVPASGNACGHGLS